jgi:hypothetical protein
MDEAALEQLGDEMMGAKETPSRAA